jgi:hypothetical protein
MGLFDSIIKDIQSFDTDRAIETYVKINTNELRELQLGQWDKGLKNTSRKLRNLLTGKTTYSKGYKAKKQRLGLSTKPDLKLSGDFRNNVNITTDIRQIRFNSTDEKAGLVTYQYNETVFGLTDKNFNILSENFKVYLTEEFLKQIR